MKELFESEEYKRLVETKDNVKKLTKEEANKGYQHHLTVGKLKEFLYKSELPNDAPVMIQRVEDFYFDKSGWKVYEVDHSYDGISHYLQPWCSFTTKEDDILFIDMHY